jgi:hypothetical protein
VAAHAAATMIADNKRDTRSPGISILLQIFICGVCCHKKAQNAQKSFLCSALID